MREIDFRMWDSTTKKYFHDPMNVFECLKQQSFYDKKLGFLAYNHIDGGCVFEQYTGLKDKNRVKIFEGDIVRITNSESQIQKMEATGAVSITPLGPMIENIHWHRIDGYINHQKTGTIYFINIVGTRIIENNRKHPRQSGNGESMIITAIDPGTDESGIVMWTPSGKPILAEKAKNEWIKSVVGMYTRPERVFVIEEINPYTMGKTIRDTILWSGRFQEAIESRGGEVVYLSRNQIRQALCGSAGPRINDTAIKQALVDRFAYGQKNFGKGTKKEPGFFYGFSKDIWQAFALAVAYAKINGFLNDK